MKGDLLVQLTNNSWYVRWFFWSLGIWLEFKEGGNFSKENDIKEEGTNLCFFIRTIFISAPLTILLHVIVYGAVVVSMTYVPVKIYGGIGYFSTILVLLSLIVAKIFYQKRKRVTPEVVTHSQLDSVKGPTFRHVVLEWVVAQKKSVCPLIKFSNQRGLKV